MKTKLAVATLLVLSSLLSGCSAVSAVSSVADAYNSARGAATAYHANDMVKDITHAQPYFSGYSSALVMADILPRDKAESLPAAFVDNFAYQLSGTSHIFHAPLSVCLQMPQCVGRTLVVQFREEAYDRNFIQKITMGDKVRGKLIYTDAASGKVLGESRIEAVDNYYAMAEMVSVSIAGAMMKSFPPTATGEPERINNDLTALPKVKPIYKDLFTNAS